MTSYCLWSLYGLVVVGVALALAAELGANPRIVFPTAIPCIWADVPSFLLGLTVIAIRQRRSDGDLEPTEPSRRSEQSDQ